MAPSSEGAIDISLSTRKIDVDNKISLRTYSRIADNLLRLADIFRLEDNTIDLYVMLLRFSSLATETIPSHRDYKTFPQGSKLYLKKKLITSLGELEELKPVVQAKIQALKTRKNFHQTSQQDSLQIRDKQYSFDWPANERHYNTDKKLLQFTGQDGYPRQNGVSVSEPSNRHFQLISQGLLRPKEETLSKHSVLGPTGLSGQWKPPSTYKIQYPSNAQFTSLAVTWNNLTQQSTKEETTSRENVQSSEPEALELGSLAEMRYDKNLTAESDSLISFDVIESPPKPEVIRQPSPPPVLTDVQELMAVSTVDTHPNPSLQNTSSDVLACCEDPLELHISTTLMDSFMRLAKSNTKRNLETCGVLAGSLKNRRFYITALIIPKQESTENSCQATNEEEIFEVQDKQSLFPLGWIHTHPTQSCFMSSIDVHTHYSYQIMLPEAIAIVMAPTDSSRTHGIFRLTSGGLSVIRQCPRRGFHSHDPPSDGMPIYSQCTDVYMNSTLQFDVIDLR